MFRLWIIFTWLLILLVAFSLSTYTSPEPTVWERYSNFYAVGLAVVFGFSLLWILLLALPEQSIHRLDAWLDRLKANAWLHFQFIFACVFLVLLILTIISRWGWGYNRFLWLSLALLGGWVSLLPTFWDWGLQGWPIKPVSVEWLAQNPHYWLPPVIGAAVLLVSNTLGFKASPQQLMLVLGLVSGIGVVLLFLRWLPFGLVALVPVALVFPSPDLPGGLNVAVLFLILLLGLWLVGAIVGRRQTSFVRSRTVWPSLALIASAVLSFGLGQLPWFSFARTAPIDAQVGGLTIFVLAAAIFLLVGDQVRDVRWLQWASWIFIGLTTVHLATWFVRPIRPYIQFYEPGTYNNSLFWVWLTALTFSQALFNRKLHPGWRLILAGIFVATLYKGVFLNSDWKSGYLPPLVTVAAIISFHSWRAGLLMVLAGIGPAIYLSSQAIATDEYSYSTRLDAWLIMLEIIKVNPLFGFGPANYYWYTPLFPIRGWAVQFNSHNQYLDIIAQTGLLGMACVFWFFGEVGWLAWRLRSQVPAGFPRAYVYGAFGGLAGTLAAGALADWFLPFTYNVGLTGFRTSMLGWMFLGGLVSLEQIYGRQPQS